jgi:DNA-binding response OmpR family regulator
VLLVHAPTDDQSMYAEYLRAHHVSVWEAFTTDAALPLIPHVQALIMGLRVPGTIDPLDLIPAIRSQWSTKPIVVVTACAYSGKIENADRAGADVVLLKPCLPDTLLAEVERVVQARTHILTPGCDRRSGHNRRAVWHGGRRDTDWIDPRMDVRIAGAIARNVGSEHGSLWAAYLAGLNCSHANARA